MVNGITSTCIHIWRWNSTTWMYSLCNHNFCRWSCCCKFDLRMNWILITIRLITEYFPIQVLSVFQELKINHPLYFIVFGESLYNGKWACVEILSSELTFFLLDAVVVTVYHVIHSVIVEGLKDPDHLNGIQAVLFGIGKVSNSDIELDKYQKVTSMWFFFFHRFSLHSSVEFLSDSFLVFFPSFWPDSVAIFVLRNP